MPKKGCNPDLQISEKKKWGKKKGELDQACATLKMGGKLAAAPGSQGGTAVFI